MATGIWVNIGSGSGLLPYGIKPLPEPMLTDHQWSPMTFILEQFHKRCLNHQSLKSIWKLHILKFHSNFPWVNSLRLSDSYASVNCASIGSDKLLVPVWLQAIIWTNVGFTIWHHYLLCCIHHMAKWPMVHLIGIIIQYTSYVTTVLDAYISVQIHPIVGSYKSRQDSTSHIEWKYRLIVIYVL